MPNTDTVPRTLVATLADEARDLYRLSTYTTRDADRALDRDNDPDRFHTLSTRAFAQQQRAEEVLAFMAYEFCLTPPVPYAPVSR